jgi:hypothetical protein
VIRDPRFLVVPTLMMVTFLVAVVLVAWPQRTHPAVRPAPAHPAACAAIPGIGGCSPDLVHVPACGGGWINGPAEAAGLRARERGGCR